MKSSFNILENNLQKFTKIKEFNQYYLAELNCLYIFLLINIIT